MTPDQVELLISAARKTLSGTHSLFDYLPLLTPIVAAALGWLAAYLQFKASFRKGLEKEHYYASKQNVLDILKLQTDFTNYLYEFYREVKNIFNYGKPLPRDFLTDFVTNYDSRLATIHLLRRIEFPESAFDDKPIIELLKRLELHITGMDERMIAAVQRREGSSPGALPPVSPNEADRFSKDSVSIINGICQELAILENIMVKILSNEATRLGLTTVMPTVHREKLPSVSATGTN